MLPRYAGGKQSRTEEAKMPTRTTKTAVKSTTTRSRTTKPKTTAATSKTATKPKTTTKSATPAKTAPKTAPVVVDAPAPVVAGPMMRKKELIDAVVARSGLKKRDVKPAVEMTLAVLGEALQDGCALNLPPMGKVKVNREKKLASGRLLIARIRQNDSATVKPTEESPVPTDEADVPGKEPAE